MQEEIFGPVMPVRTYTSFEDTVREMNARPRPLALYYFGDDEAESEALLYRTHSGGVTINDVIFHFAMDDLPFGGVGPSGMGAYHGHRGFLEFSHEKAIYRQTGERNAGDAPPAVRLCVPQASRRAHQTLNSFDRTFTYVPGASASACSGPSPGARAGTSGPESFVSHASQCGHQEPGCSAANACQSSSVLARLGLVQY